MTEPLQVGQFAIVDHEPVDRGPNAGVFHGKGPTDDRAELFIVAEGTTPAGEAFAGHVISALGHVFSSLDMSLTGSLRRLFDEAARNVADWNRKSIAQHHVSIGLNCFARRDGQAVIAQAGPSVAFHLHDGHVTAYYADEEHGRPIGAGEPAMQLTRIDFGPGDRLLLISTVALRELDDETISGILALPGMQALQDLYHRLIDVRHLTAVLVAAAGPADLPAPEPAGNEEFVIGQAQQAEAPGEGSSQPQTIAVASEPTFQPSLFIEARKTQLSVEAARRQLLAVTPRRRHIEPGAAVPAIEMPAPLLRVSGDTTLSRLAAERRSHAQRMHDANASASRYLALRTPAATAIEPLPARRHGRQDSFSRGLVRDDAPPPEIDPAVKSMPRANELAAERRAQSVSVVAPVTGDVIAGDTAASITTGGSLVRLRPNMGGRWKGGGTLSRGGTIAGSLPPTWLVILVGLGILVGLVGFLTIPKLMDQQSSEHYSQLISGAEQRLSASKVEQDAAQKRTDLTEAQAMLLEAQGMSDAGPEVQTFLNTANAAIAVMDAVKQPAAVQTLGSLDQFGDKPVSAARLTVGQDTAYILDSTSNQVIAMPLAGGTPAVVYSANAGKKQGNPIATAFLEAAGGAPATLLIADAANGLWAYSAGGGLHQIAFAAPSGLHITDIDTNGANLYVLDASQNAVFEFAQTDGAYGAAPTIALQTPDLAAARRLSVGDDIVTSDASGALHRFTGNVALTLSAAGIDQKLVGPDAPQTLPGDGDIAVLDAPNDRIVALKRDGTFDYQYRSKDFQASTAFAIRDGVGYLFSNAQLKKVTFTK